MLLLLLVHAATMEGCRAELCVSVERANLGCRTLVYHNFSKMLSGIVGDLADWVVATRIKAVQLLYTLLVNEEDNVTQHVDTLLSALYNALADTREQPAVVVNYVSLSVSQFGN